MSDTILRIQAFIVLLMLSLALVGCAAANTSQKLPEEPAMHTISEFSDDENLVEIRDPWEKFNRSMYDFNYRFDRYVFLPVVNSYEFITPTFVQKGVSNFYLNIGEICTLYNSIFQLRSKKILTTTSRFMVNTTLGIGGLFDTASYVGMKRQDEDFGQTLGRWGVGSGPYLVVPILGPNTVRSTSGYGIDAGIRYAYLRAIDPFGNVDGGIYISAGTQALEDIDLRHREPFRYYDSEYPFEYNVVRFLYFKMSQLELMQ